MNFNIIYFNVHKQNKVLYLTTEVTFVCSSKAQNRVLFVYLNVNKFKQVSLMINTLWYQ